MFRAHFASTSFSKVVVCLTLVAGVTFGVSAADVMAMDSATEAQQSKVNVKGVVKDAAGLPVIGASVIEKGVSSNGTVTDIDGNFSIDVTKGATLVVSSIGYVTVEVPESAAAEITLEEDAEMLEDVVVIGYGTQKKGDVTSAITSVKADDFAKGNIKDAGDLIKGKVAGLSIT